MSKDVEVIHNATMILEKALSEVNKMLASYLKSGNTTTKSSSQKKQKKSSQFKKPLSAFFIFSQKQRDVIKANYPEMTNIQISQSLGEIWNNLPVEERRPYEEESKKLKEKFYEDHPELKNKKREKKEKQ